MTTISANTRFNEDLKFPRFEDNKVSTKTIIAVTNLLLNLENVIDKLPVTEYKIVPKRRGRKKKTERIEANKDIKCGSIITLKYEDQIRGVDLKKKKNSAKSGKYFRNSVTVVMVIDGKNINFKVSRNGKFQMTGCKSDEQAEKCIKYFWSYIECQDNIYQFYSENHFKVLFVPAMRNIDFGLGFKVDREALAKYINLNTPYYAMLETTIGYTGVNIKFPMTNDLNELELKKFEHINKEWIESFAPYSDYLDILTPKEREKKINKDRYHTFLVFQSGRIIFSSATRKYGQAPYYEFLDIVRRSFDLIEERLDT